LPIFEADLYENGFDYRPKRRAQLATDAIKIALLSGRREVVDADLSGYIDTIPHGGLMRFAKGRVSDGSILKLIKGSLQALASLVQDVGTTSEFGLCLFGQGCGHHSPPLKHTAF
jgi:retron-type reverse transcriptase